MFKFINLALLIFMSLGFKILEDARWGVTPDDPYLWVKLCDRTPTITGSIPSGDQFYTNSDSIADVVQTVLDDVNAIEGSFLTLELYPADPNNPPSGSHFDATKAATRTIDLCGVEYGGAATPVKSGNTITGCRLEYGTTKYHANIISFLNIITHELGHCLNLAHSQEQSNAIMSYFKKDTDMIRLDVDDKSGLSYLYPSSSYNLKEKNSYGLSCDN
jgi:hypothetical protein